jgi:tetratricopeptide (TPR) repeat protein
MSIFKCKMCGGTIEFNPGDTVGVCDSCGTKQTLPTTNDEIITNLHNRANTLRLKCEFDKAEEIYNKILEKNPDDAEAHWGIILCKYGIEYVEDPKTYNRVPTCHRTSFDAILADEDYKAALANGDGAQRELYEEEAKKIDRIQKDILSIVHNEKPFDVFICYKETDENGNRTQDSVIANDIYHQLTQEGFKVFYAAITLEDKVGQEYEPYIFAALNSAKVMLVVGSKPEYFTAVWVKNEWSRFLKLIKTDRSKLLIPCYRNMDAYELPEEFAHLQAQDMSKIGFINDLVRGIRKVVADTDSQEKTVRESVAVNSGNANEESLLKRAFMFLEDGDWDSANEYCEKVLDIDPENARAYLGKLMAECRACRLEDLQNCEQPFDDSGNYNKVLRFADSKLIETLKGYIAHINERNENACLTGIYNGAVNAMNSANSEGEYKAAAKIFKSIPGFKDADNLVEKCLDKAEVCRKDALYNSACSNMTGNIIRNYESAIKTFETISGWKDADEKIRICQEKIENLKLEAERKAEEQRIAAEKTKKKIKKIIAIAAPIVCVLIVFLILLKTVIIPKQKYNQAMELISSGDYDSAYAQLKEIGDKKTINSSKYDRAIKYIDSGDYKVAYMLLDGLSYKDSAEKFQSVKQALIKNAKVGDIVYFGTYEQDNDTSNGKENIEWLVLAKKDNKILVISDKALDCQPYNTSDDYVTWEKCTLREWLNNDFINAAFSDDEKAMIPTVTVSADSNLKYNTNPGNTTKDKVFLLSIVEAEKYFTSDEARMCIPTEYVISNVSTSDEYTKDGKATCWWRLRSPGAIQYYAAKVDFDGDVDEFGIDVDYDIGGVRPALWITIDG